MPRYKIADVVVSLATEYDETSHWYEPYITSEPLSFPKTLACNKKDIDYLVTQGVGITEPIAENVLLCNLFNRLLIRFDGSFIHSSAIMIDNKVYLISGNSGVGKSTLTRRLLRLYPQGSVIINDDKPSFRIIDDKCIVYGTPFAGGTDIQCNMSGELGGIVFLEQAQEDKLVTLTSAESLCELLQQTPRKLSRGETDKLFEFYEKIISAYPIYKLFCTDSDNAAHTAYKITQ
ncbi:MAG: hypothetical protein IJ298_10525 [Ruminococcus sp.]|nr:hypothetical protein [Ruminococcus sp.]